MLYSGIELCDVLWCIMSHCVVSCPAVVIEPQVMTTMVTERVDGGMGGIGGGIATSANPPATSLSSLLYHQQNQ